MADTKQELAEVIALLDSESKKWNELGLHPNHLQGVFSPELFFIVAMKMDALITYLQEKNIIVDPDDFELWHRRRMFTKLREIRHKIQEDKAKQPHQSGIVTPTPILLGPDGQPVKM